ncbi:histidine phosphatase family protein [Micromonospora sagamiensis]|uniref:Alpha-ribazole phosphatase/probable phosphoglycerate mutase n=1 Tax=Micromonospora sagamiensis TaxID=47875 RepID=A0A562WJB3_9ACTN|nr:histidine phosphatase family protein [Micromonospora sagamiensis]TWJ30275.1 alpha-ribazole phosphatase/probable phosphoglycerate mutase [Micromonospora sagamiensis]BCL16695.1 hypothetical protein GCM10017556_44340 [Micromonospora sagamiensis]
MAVDIVYETHSLTIDNETGRATGWLPGTLSPQGRRLARDLGVRRPADALDAIFCSDLARAVETVEIAYAGWPAVARRDRRLRECDYGELNGMPVEELDRQRPGRVDVPFPGGGLPDGWDGTRPGH